MADERNNPLGLELSNEAAEMYERVYRSNFARYLNGLSEEELGHRRAEIEEIMTKILHAANEQCDGDYDKNRMRDDFVPSNYLLNLENEFAQMADARNYILSLEKARAERDLGTTEGILESRNHMRNTQNISNMFNYITPQKLYNMLTEEQKQLVEEEAKQKISEQNGQISYGDLVDIYDKIAGPEIVNRGMDIAMEENNLQVLSSYIFTEGMQEYIGNPEGGSIEEFYDGIQSYIEDRVNRIEKYGFDMNHGEVQDLIENLSNLYGKNLQSELGRKSPVYTYDVLAISRVLNNTSKNIDIGNIKDINQLIKISDFTVSRICDLRKALQIKGKGLDQERLQRKMREAVRYEHLLNKYNKYVADKRIAREKEIKQALGKARYQVAKRVPKIKEAIFARGDKILSKYWNNEYTPEKEGLFKKIGNFFNKFRVTDNPTKNIARRANMVAARGFSVDAEMMENYKILKGDHEKLKERVLELEKYIKQEPLEVNKEQEINKETEMEQNVKQEVEREERQEQSNFDPYKRMTEKCSDLTQLSMIIKADISKTEVDYKNEEIVLHGYAGETLRFDYNDMKIIENTFPSEIDNKEIDYEKLVGAVEHRQVMGEMKNNEFRRGEGKDIVECMRELDIKKDISLIESSFAQSLGCDTAKIDLDRGIIQAYSIDNNEFKSFTVSLRDGNDINMMHYNKSTGEMEECAVTSLAAQTIISEIRDKLSDRSIEKEEQSLDDILNDAKEAEVIDMNDIEFDEFYVPEEPDEMAF